ncbi:Wzz/FepE/Etk N-terminal domain-containing protein [Catalinimonas sp. 4WD22]|uniref:GumC family protein n=1 Tax=Catalinimonas locisalis TaxID=3133978 RepID=UPI0031015176
MKNIPDQEFIDIRKVLYHVLDKWWYFVISVPFCMALAFFYLKTAPKTYEVKAKMQLKDQSLNDKGVGQEKFMNGLELLAGNSELEDEIGILSSYSMVQEALKRLNFTVSIYQYPDKFGPLGKMMEEEVYDSNFRIKLDNTKPQVINVPIHISFPDADHYKVTVEANEATLFDLQTQRILQDKLKINVEKVLPLDEACVGSFINFHLEMDSSFVLPEGQAYFFTIHSQEQLIENYTNKLEISPIAEESNIVSLTTKGRSPAKEAAFLDALTETYIEHDLQKKNQLGVKAIEFIDKQLSSVHDSLRTVEGSLEDFRTSSNVIDVGVTSQNLTEQVQELEAERAQLSVQQEYYEYTYQQLRNESFNEVVAPSSVGIQDNFLNNLLIELAELNQEKVEKAYSANKSNPLLEVLERKILNTRSTLMENIANRINSNKMAMQENQRQINRFRTQINRLPESERNLKRIERTYTLNDNIYNYLLEKKAEAGLALASNLPDKSVIDKARTSSQSPVSPNKKTMLLLAFLSGIGLPLGLIWGQYFFKNKVTDKSDLEEIEHIPMLGVIPGSPKGYKLPVIQVPESAIAEAFRFLRITLDQQWAGQKQEQKSRVIGITSTQAGDGKTFCAANLAASYARSRRKTLLIGADLRNPRIHKYFNAKEFGMSTYLESDVSNLDTLVQSTPLPHLDLLGGSKPSVDIEWLLESERLKQLFGEAQEQYEVIIVDTPPVGLVADFYNLTTFFHQNLFVVRHDATDVQMFKGVLNKLSGTNQVSMVLNDAEGYVIKEYGHQYSNRSYYAQPT